MTQDQILVAQLKRDESYRRFPYLDCCGKPWRECTCEAEGKKRGYLTIGIGRNLDANGIDPFEAEYLLANDIGKVEVGLDRGISWWRQLSDPLRRALVNLGFNLGVAGLLLFKNTLALIHDGDRKAAVKSFRSNTRYFSQVGNRAERIAKVIESDSLEEKE